jgi:acetyl esterase/lipase
MNRVVENKANRWLAKGIIFVTINYRMLPKADPLTQANDVALALAKAQSLAPSWGGDSKRFVMMGHSAGAHLVALLSANPSLAKRQGAQPWLGTVMLDSAAYDIEKTMLSKHLPLYDKAFGNDHAFWKSTSPSDLLTQKTVPMLAVCSTKRKDQPCTQASAFVNKAVKFGSQANVLPETLSHSEINENLGLPSEYTEKVEAFMRKLGLPL